MKLTSALRSPNRSRATVRPDASDQVDETQLGRAATLTQLAGAGWAVDGADAACPRYMLTEPGVGYHLRAG